MPECPYCFGEGGHDLRDTNAYLREHLPDHVLEMIPLIDLEWEDCPECETTGIVSVERRAEIEAAARADVDQFLAKLRETER